MPKSVHPHQRIVRYIAVIFISVIVLTISLALSFVTQDSQEEIAQRSRQEQQLKQQLAATQKELEEFKNQDQVKINEQNKQEIENVQKTYDQAVKSYESLLDLGVTNKNFPKLSEQLAQSLKQLSQKNYTSATATLTDLNKAIEAEKQTIATQFTIPSSVQEKSTPPASGYARQQVVTSVGTYMVDIVSGDLASTRVIVDTASESDCANDCPVLALGDYVARNGGYAGINGSYFCPASYPSCAGKTNSFDTLLMNKNKKYFNSDNNVYSTVPAVIFQGGGVRFVGRSLDWGRDTGIDSMIANQPLLVSGGSSVFGGDGEVKREGKGSRSFVANRGNIVYIGVVHNVSASEMAKVLETMGMDNALNLDSGGSTALWAGGYKVGPGRNIPNAIVFIRK
ncbi:MAG TPA: phosphodiester glycosidase family protein [Candidatus Levybacteria bacterium]|nr:phosphodiester glycosidase family protein [Candidatus Levybacteria bacterium]